MMTIYEALAEPMRRRILDLLRERPHLVGELAELLEISQPGVSKHLRVLCDAQAHRARLHIAKQLQTKPSSAGQ